MSEQVFAELLARAGIPATKTEAEAQLRAKLREQDSRLTNASEFSPFLNLCSALLSQPLLALRKQLLERILPGMYLQTAQGDFLDLLAEQRKIKRRLQRKARGHILFRRETTDGQTTIPEKTQVSSAPINQKTYTLTTLAPARIDEGESSVLVLCEALEPGSAYNLSADSYTILSRPVPGVVAVNNLEDWLSEPGTDTEDDETLRSRARDKIMDSARWHLEESYRSMIARQTGAPGRLIFFLKGTQGRATAYATLETGTLSQEVIQKANTFINERGNHGLGDQMTLEAMPTTDIELKIRARPENTALVNQIGQYIHCVFRENAAFENAPKVTPRETLYFSALAGECHRAFDALRSILFLRQNDEPYREITPGLSLPVLRRLTVNETVLKQPEN